MSSATGRLRRVAGVCGVTLLLLYPLVLLEWGGSWSERTMILVAVGLCLALLDHWVVEKGLLLQTPAFALLEGRKARVRTACDPLGTVVLDGSVWQARSNDGSHLPPQEDVIVCGGTGLVLEVARRTAAAPRAGDG